MKKLFIVTLLFLTACAEKDVMTYDSANYIQFQKSITDSTSLSFFFFPDQLQIKIPLVMELVGFPTEKDVHYKLEVDEKYSNISSVNYILPDEFVFRSGRAVDTCYIVFVKTPDIDAASSLRLVLRVKDTDELLVGRELYDGAIIRVSNSVVQPDWWDRNVTNYRLGIYSDKKYELFIRVTGQYDLSKASDSEIANYSRMLKNYLQKEKDAGRPVYEKDGSLMSVAIVG